MEIIIEIIGIVLIFAATDVGKNKETQIKLFSWDYLLQLILIFAGLTLVINSELIQHGLK